MKKSVILTGILLSVVLLSGCSLNKKFAPDTIIKVNGQGITKNQYEKAFDKIVDNSALSQIGIDLKKDPDSYYNLLLREKVVNDLIVKSLLEQEIKTRKIKVSQEEFDKEYNKLIEKIGSKEKFNELLKQNKVSIETFKDDLKEEVKVQKLVDTLGKVNVSDKDVEKYYKQNIKEFNYPERVKSAHILISADPVQIKDLILAKPENKNLSKADLDKKVKEELAAKQKKAEEILAKVKLDPTQFAQIAKENSDDPYTAPEGGDLGFMSKEQMPEFYAKVAFTQKPNTISNLVTTPYGYHIIMVTDRQKAGVEPLEKVKFELRNYLEQQEKTQILQKFVEDTLHNANIEYLDEAYNPNEIDKKIKEAQKKNPSLMGEQSAKE